MALAPVTSIGGDSSPAEQRSTAEPVPIGRPALEKKAWNPSYLAGARILNRPLQSSWNVQTAVDEGFKASSWVYICVDKIARSVASAGWVTQKRVSSETEQWKVETDSELNSLVEKPNSEWSMGELMYRWTAGLLLGGNAVVHKTRGLGDRVAELWTMGPNGVSPIPDKEEFISGYEVTDGDGKKETYDADNIIHDQLPDPDNPHWGISPLMAGAKAVDIDREASNYQRNGLSNRAVVDGMLSLENIKKKSQIKEAREILSEQHQGADNARNFLVMGNNARYQQLALTPQEMDFIESRKLSREEICALFGTPPPTVGIYDNATLANIETARQILWQDTVIPLLSQIRGTLNTSLAAEFGDGLRVNYDISQIEALIPVFARKVEIAAQLFEMGVPFKQINRRLGLGFGEIVGADIGYVPGNLIPADVNQVDQMGA